MRRTDERSGGLFSYVDLEARVRADHPVRATRSIVNDALRDLAPDFGTLYSRIGRPSIAPERLLRAMLLQAFLFGALGATADGASRHRPVVSLARRSGDRRSGLGRNGVFEEPRPPARRRGRGEAWASMKSFKPKDGSGDEPPSGSGRNLEVDFKGRKRSNETHASTADPEARLYRKDAGHGGETRLPRTRLDGELLLPDRQRLPSLRPMARPSARRGWR
jgi:hypothetical protein